MRASHLLATFAALSGALCAQERADLAALLEPIRAEHGVPALGAAVIRDGAVVALGVTGVRRQGHEEKVTTDDLWHLGSCTKAMTATLLAQQVDAGKLQWSTTVAAGLPDLAGKFDEHARAITVRHLLTHRAGLPGGPPQPLWRELFRYEGTTREARREVATAMLGIAPEAPLGERYLYSNASYMIAGAIAERAADASWEELMQRQLFTPLGMRSAGFGPPGSKDDTSQPWGHRPGPKGPVPIFGDNPPALGPAGTVHCTLADWAKFAALHLGVVAGDEPLVTAERLRELHTPPEGADYALGWGVTTRPWAKGPILSHSGSNTMWYCVAWLAPEAKFGVLVTCNQGEAGAACDAVAGACIRRFAPARAGAKK
ncbi:MAG: beta-lactamase family protein [Planctomycetes bacterium]|nr:beta-lactamase family protein [Planctomycetota bacterium]MCB9885422.1 beta-lactamase family protein [Planctomycetota bacterium]